MGASFVAPLLAALLLAQSAAASSKWASATLASSSTSVNAKLLCTVRVADSPLPREPGAARARLNSSAGFSLLEVWAPAPSTGVDARASAFLAGCVEGALTSSKIFDLFTNAKANLFPGRSTLPLALDAFLAAQLAWLRSEAALRTNEDTFWRAMAWEIARFDGLDAGFHATATPGRVISSLELYAIASSGDLDTLQDAISPGGLSMATHCSALIKLIAGGTDALISHATWTNYWTMIRVYKILHLEYASPPTTISMSSYPGLLGSNDDWYTSSASALFITETTNAIYNKSLFSKLTPFAAFTWQRANVATLIARNGSEWTDQFTRYNSGTQNNQWMVLDTKLLGTEKKKNRGERATMVGPEAGALWIVEQIPGRCERADVTPILIEQGYWGSYNVPYFPSIFRESGYPAGPAHAWANVTRARIFRRNASDVVDEESLGRLMRWNNFCDAADPLTHGGDPMDGAIAARGDLSEHSPAAFGCTDAKLARASHLRAPLRERAAEGGEGAPNGTHLVVHLVNGPTTAGPCTPPFDWGTSPAAVNVSHVGIAEVMDCAWQMFDVQDSTATGDAADERAAQDDEQSGAQLSNN